MEAPLHMLPVPPLENRRFSLSSDTDAIDVPGLSPELSFRFKNKDSFRSKCIALPDGVNIQAVDIRLSRPKTYSFKADGAPLIISFCLEGRADISACNHGRPMRSIVHSPAMCNISHLPHVEGTWSPAHSRCRMIDLRMPVPQSVPVWKEFRDGLPSELAPLARGASPGDFFHCLPVTPDIQAAVCNLSACPVQGPGRNLYLQCKAREILILMITHMCRMRSLNEKAIPLTDADLRGIHDARRLLEENMENPPTLVKLARMTGLNEFKLKKGFRQVFGITPYTHLREVRLDAARAHLESGTMNVYEACIAVGYSSLGNFIGLFKKKYGVTPGDVLRSASRTRHLPN